MRRFSKAEAGDLVYCRLKGAGFIAYTNIRNDEIRAKFQPGANIYYDCTGRKNSTDIEPMLFYRSSTDNYLTERPEPEVDWANMEKGTALVSVGYAEETPAYFLTLSNCDHIWIYYNENRTTAYSVHVSRWKPKVKETTTCQKA